MKLAFTFVVLAFFAQVQAQTQTPLQEMVRTEQAFSRTAAEKNPRDAFMEFIADDGLLFRPGAVNGKKWMLAHPVPASDKHPTLAWQPKFAGMSASGDLGFTTGPWEAKDDVNDANPARYGHFVTLWKKQKDSSWKFVVDLGISHPESGGPQTIWNPPVTTSPPPRKHNIPLEVLRNSLLDLDHFMAERSEKRELAKLFSGQFARDVRLYRNGSLPFIGSGPATKALTAVKGKMSWKPLGADVASAGDLGYTHGTYEIKDDKRKVIERGSYVRIWRYEGEGVWRIVLDVANAH
jgi:ketosteroid isomerase-like protein